MTESEVILEVGTSGGCVQLRGSHFADGSWTFFVDKNESAVFGLLQEDERNGLKARDQSACVNSFEDALKLFDQYPWHRLFPIRIHPDFQDRVFQIVKQRKEAECHERLIDLSDWEYLCGK
jgi:hypothetical protein